MMLRVGESGEVTEVRTYSPTGCAALDAAAEERARALAFTPAQKEGRAVRAWVRIVYRID